MDRGQCVAQMGRAILVRNEIRWPILVNGSPWRRLPIDDFFMGDRLQFSEGTTGTAVLRVVVSYGQAFRDACAGAKTGSLKANYEVQIDAPCPSCGDRGAHTIEITPQDVTHCTPTWPLIRSCTPCGARWIEEASFPQIFYDELLTAIRS